MPEQNAEKKKPGIVRRIFKWIGLGLLSLLLIAGLVFQAPWKVTALWLVILLACTALPKPLRKWFWLSVGVIMLALIIWVFLPDDSEGWRPYTFDEELAALQAKYAIPDEENAAVIYKELLESFDPKPVELSLADPNAYYLALAEHWSRKDFPELAEWIDGREGTMVALLEACKKEECRFPIHAEPISTDEIYRRLAFREWAMLLCCAANRDMGEGNTDRAIEKYACILRVAEHFYQQGAALDLLVAFALDGIALTRLNRFMIEGQPSSEQLKLVSKLFKNLRNNWGSDFHRVLKYDKLYAKNTCGRFYEINSEGNIRVSRNVLPAIRPHLPYLVPILWYNQHLMATLLYGELKFRRVLTPFAWLFMSSTPHRAAEIIDTRYSKYNAMAEPDFDWDKERPGSGPRFRLNYHYLIDLEIYVSGANYYRFHDMYLKFLALRRGSLLLTAIRQYRIEHGTWPATLDAVKSRVPAEAYTDPVTGKDFIYENHGDGFSLYCEAANIWPK